MPVVSMNTRLAALEEKRGGGGDGPMVAVLMAENTSAEDAAQQIADAQASWARGHGRPFPDDGRVMRIVLIGVSPSDRRGADAH